MIPSRTQVGIVGAGPAGLMFGHLLHLHGIDSVIVEDCSQEHVTWRAQRFSWWMTAMLHRSRNDNAFDHRRQIAELEYLVSSRAAMTSLAENYVGIALD